MSGRVGRQLLGVYQVLIGILLLCDIYDVLEKPRFGDAPGKPMFILCSPIIYIILFLATPFMSHKLIARVFLESFCFVDQSPIFTSTREKYFESSYHSKNDYYKIISALVEFPLWKKDCHRYLLTIVILISEICLLIWFMCFLKKWLTDRKSKDFIERVHLQGEIV